MRSMFSVTPAIVSLFRINFVGKESIFFFYFFLAECSSELAVVDLLVFTRAPQHYNSWPFAAGCADDPGTMFLWPLLPLVFLPLYYYIILLRESSGNT